jgi:hypothetical protein
MRRRRCFPVFSFTVLLFFIFTGVTPPVFADENEDSIPLSDYLFFSVKTKRLFNSHTSYEFGNPFPPNQAPLSRLEFPLDSWWYGGELRANLRRFSLGVEALANFTGDTEGTMKDSDWDDDPMPSLRTIYSESNCSIRPSYMIAVDMSLEVSDWVGLPEWFSLRPVTGFRWQYFNVVTHDGVQYDISQPDPTPLPGDGISFKQEYWQYFVGLRSNIDAGRFVNITGLDFFLQFDWAYVEGGNVDHHLLREGNRYTYENTYGEAWHVSAGFKKSLYKSLFLGVEAEYLLIKTTGTHQLVNNVYDVYYSWSNEVNVWSEQMSASLSLEYRF